MNLQVLAGADLTFDVVSRSYPLVAVTKTTLGYGMVFWGDANQKPWYGYLRPSVSVSAIPGFAALGGQLEFFPVSILGVRAGKEYADLNAKHPKFDCDTYKCAQRFTREYYGANLTLGAGPIFMNVDVQREELLPHSVDRDFITPAYALLIEAEGEKLDTTRAILGTRLGGNWLMYGLSLMTETTESEKKSRLSTINFSYRLTPQTTLSVGAGTFKSDLKSEEFSALATFKWKISPSVGLF